jgi:fibronectin-binding autotransporter adhesin
MMRSYKLLKQGASWIALLMLAASPARAASGSWDILQGGNWGTAGFWANNIIADGADSTASFNKNITANKTITLDSDRTIGNLYFNDSGGGADSRWTLQSNVLTLETTTGIPVINIGSAVGVPVYISSVLAGTQGFEKKGNGTLMINGAATYTGDTVISDGNIRLNADNYLPAASVLGMSSGGTLQMMGYNQTFAGLYGSGGAVECNFNAGSANVLTLAVAGAESYSYSGVLQDGNEASVLNIVKSGTGTQTIAGDDNDYSGTMTVADGTLIVDGDNSGATGDVTVSFGAALGGSGIIGGETTVAGELRPGNSPGTLSFIEALTLLDSSETTFEIVSLASYDVLAGDGDNIITFDDGAGIVFDFTGSSVSLGEVFTVLSGWGAIADNGADISYTGLGGLDLDISTFGDGYVTVVPEPATAGMVGLFGVLLYLLRRYLRS